MIKFLAVPSMDHLTISAKYRNKKAFVVCCFQELFMLAQAREKRNQYLSQSMSLHFCQKCLKTAFKLFKGEKATQGGSNKKA